MSDFDRNNAVLETLEAIARGAGAVLTPFNRPNRLRWGATDAEISMPLPGDELVPEVRWRYTHAITIQAPPEAVWPWVVQIGAGRGGFYSYEALENLIGCQIVNAETILPEFQHPQPGDTIRIHPAEGAPAFPVVTVDPPRDFLLGGAPKYDEKLKSTIGVSWLFHLQPAPFDSTRLIVRWRAYYEPESFANRVFFGPALMEPVSFVMGTKMLEGIRRRAEASVQPYAPTRANPIQAPIMS